MRPADGLDLGVRAEKEQGPLRVFPPELPGGWSLLPAEMGGPRGGGSRSPGGRFWRRWERGACGACQGHLQEAPGVQERGHVDDSMPGRGAEDGGVRGWRPGAASSPGSWTPTSVTTSIAGGGAVLNDGRFVDPDRPLLPTLLQKGSL